MNKLMVTCLMLTLIVRGVAAQDYQPDSKIKLYITAAGKRYSQAQVDSIRRKAKWFTFTHPLKTKLDTAYFSLSHFDFNELPDRYQKEGSYCGNWKRRSQKSIKKLFPYRETETIKFVSFKPVSDTSREQKAIPKTNGVVDLSKMFEVKDVQGDVKLKTLDVLVNYSETGTGEILMCYEPRNGIVFLDKNQRVLGYVEICFGCLGYIFEPRTMAVGAVCFEKVYVLQSLFIRAGITYGVNGEED